MPNKPKAVLTGTVEMLVKPLLPNGHGMAQISIDEAAPLYRDIRIDDTLTDPSGHEVHLKAGAKVEVTIKAETKEAAIGLRTGI